MYSNMFWIIAEGVFMIFLFSVYFDKNILQENDFPLQRSGKYIWVWGRLEILLIT